MKQLKTYLTQLVGTKKIGYTRKKPVQLRLKRRSFFSGWTKQLQNSLKRKKKIHLWPWIFLFFLGVIGIIILSPLLQIQRIYITREGHTVNIEQAYATLDYLRGKHIFLLDNKEIAERLQSSQPAIENIRISLRGLRTINIELEAFPNMYQSTDYLILENGSILTKNSKVSSELPEIFISKNIEELALFGEHLNTQELNIIQNIRRELSRNIPGFEIETLLYLIEEKELIVSEAGTSTLFFFDISRAALPQIEKLSIFQKEEIDITEKSYIYIDVRIPGRLFLCGIEEEALCVQNLRNIYNPTLLKQRFSQLKL